MFYELMFSRIESEITGALQDGWEPFAVTDGAVWLRRETGRSDAAKFHVVTEHIEREGH